MIGDVDGLVVAVLAIMYICLGYDLMLDLAGSKGLILEEF